jgi:hypothetical protein
MRKNQRLTISYYCNFNCLILKKLTFLRVFLNIEITMPVDAHFDTDSIFQYIRNLRYMWDLRYIRNLQYIQIRNIFEISDILESTAYYARSKSVPSLSVRPLWQRTFHLCSISDGHCLTPQSATADKKNAIARSPSFVLRELTVAFKRTLLWRTLKRVNNLTPN